MENGDVIVIHGSNMSLLKNRVFTLYIIQAQCRELLERKPVFLNNSLYLVLLNIVLYLVLLYVYFFWFSFDITMNKRIVICSFSYTFLPSSHQELTASAGLQ